MGCRVLRVAAFAALATAAAACGRHQNAATAPTGPLGPRVVEIPPATADQPTVTSGMTICEKERGEQDRLAEALLPGLPTGCGTPIDCSVADGELSRLQDLAKQCFAGARGAWVSRLSGEPWSGRHGSRVPGARWDFVDTQGRRTTAPVEEADGRSVKVGFDYDGDGFVELVVERRGEASGAIFTMRSGRVERYASPPFARVKDVDEDGRPDLLGYGRFDAVVAGCNGTQGASDAVTVHGPEVMFHALSGGTFTDQDPVARTALDEECNAENAIDDIDAATSPDRFGPSIACAVIKGEKGKARAAIARVGRGASCSGSDPFDRPAMVRALTRWLD